MYIGESRYDFLLPDAVGQLSGARPPYLGYPVVRLIGRDEHALGVGEAAARMASASRLTQPSSLRPSCVPRDSSILPSSILLNLTYNSFTISCRANTHMMIPKPALIHSAFVLTISRAPIRPPAATAAAVARMRE